MSRPMTTNEFVKRAKDIHGDKYDYSLVEYKNNYTPVKLICNSCGTIFLSIPSNHLVGKGCKLCSYKKIAKAQCLTTEEFIKRAKAIHGDEYDYSQVNYINNHTKVKIFCKTCKSYFLQQPDKHLAGHDCNCKKAEKMYNKLVDSLQTFIKKAKEVHSNRYDYSKVNYYNSCTKVCIKCNKCNRYFYVTPANHLRSRGCPYCKQSKGELAIMKWLDANNIEYTFQKRFNDCRDTYTLPFDFYLPAFNMCIEYQGKQHYFKWHLDTDESNLQKIKVHDKIKKEYCEKHGILLLEIKYTENINKKLEEAINECL